MSFGSASIYLSTFLLEKNRWNGKGPSVQLTEWFEPAAEAGFRGLEIWSPHLYFTSRSDWDLLRIQSQETDLPVVFLDAGIPFDNSDKCRKQQDSLAEAAGFFAPQGIKFSPEALLPDNLSKAADWARDLPRDVFMVASFHETPKPGVIPSLRRMLGSRFRCAFNPFAQSLKELEASLKEAERTVINMGVRVNSGTKYFALRDNPKSCEEVVALVRKLGFNGSWTLECTEGVGVPGEDMDALFDESEEDMNYLTEVLSGK